MFEDISSTLLHREIPGNPEFPYAPPDWSPEEAEAIAGEEDLTLSPEHWEVIRDLQNYFARHEGQALKLRELHDALDEKFHIHGGLRHLYEILPGGPVAQGCRLAGVTAPAAATDLGIGSIA